MDPSPSSSSSVSGSGSGSGFGAHTRAQTRGHGHGLDLAMGEGDINMDLMSMGSSAAPGMHQHQHQVGHQHPHQHQQQGARQVQQPQQGPRQIQQAQHQRTPPQHQRTPPQHQHQHQQVSPSASTSMGQHQHGQQGQQRQRQRSGPMNPPQGSPRPPYMLVGQASPSSGGSGGYPGYQQAQGQRYPLNQQSLASMSGSPSSSSLAAYMQYAPIRPSSASYSSSIPFTSPKFSPSQIRIKSEGNNYQNSIPGDAPPLLLPPVSFQAPAHKHAHHLHSIPPREKSTRTLIIDHMLSVHARTRFAQARAELGMTDRTGGSTSPHYIHRTRPEGYDEDDEAPSEGEDITPLLSRPSPSTQPLSPSQPQNPTPTPTTDPEEFRLGRQKLGLARTLRLRAEALEKVVTSMLEQTPPVHTLPEDLWTPPSSPRLDKWHAKRVREVHRLPNGVRLRLGLGTIVNDLFARQAPGMAYRHMHEGGGEEHGKEHGHGKDHGKEHQTEEGEELPEALWELATVSGAFSSVHGSNTAEAGRPLQSHTPPYTVGYNTSAYPPNPYQPQHQPRSPVSPPGFYPSPSHTQNQNQNNKRPRFTPSQRAKSLYTAGADPSTAHSPPGFRCPRHLHIGCEICVEARATHRNTKADKRGGVNGGSSGSGYAFGGYGSGSGAGSGGGKTTTSGWKAPGGGGITGWQDGSGIGSGLLRPGVRGSALRRRVPEVEQGNAPSWAAPRAKQGGGAGNTKLSKLIPRFVRLSALVAFELGREARGEEGEESDEEDEGAQPPGEEGGEGDGREEEDAKEEERASRLPSTPRQTSLPSNSNQNQNSNSPSLPLPTRPASAPDPTNTPTYMHKYAFRPTAEWYMLLAGLLTRAVLEGYLTAGWRGVGGVECLLSIGLGIGVVDDSKERGKKGKGEGGKERRGRSRGSGEGEEGRDDHVEEDEPEEEEEEEEEEEFAMFDPDQFPSLVDAVRILFPSLRSPASASSSTTSLAGVGARSRERERELKKGEAEEQYEVEMMGRLRKFYDIPSSTPDCSTHMEDLAWQYPAEPVERAAVRFCEAIAKWRGKPELESKPPSHSLSTPSAFSHPGQADDEALATPRTMAMAMESLVHSNPASPDVGLHHTGGDGEREKKRRKLDKPRIDVYFVSSAASGPGEGREGRETRRRESWSRGSTFTGAGGGLGGMGGVGMGMSMGMGNKRYRDADDAGRGDPSKRMYA